MTVRPVSWSSAAVGSSQTSSRGSCTSARAMATRCFWPPESWLGRLFSFLPIPSDDKTSPALRTASFLRPTGDHQRNRRVLGGRERGQEVVLLEDKADVPGAKPVISRSLIA